MFECRHERQGLCFDFSARLENVDHAVKSVQEWLEGQMLHGHLFRMTLIMREALNNAVIHGAGNDENKKIIFSITRKKKTLLLKIKDPGPGFGLEFEKVRQPICRPGACPESGWGLALLRKYSSGLSYDPADKVTFVTYSLHEAGDDKYRSI